MLLRDNGVDLGVFLPGFDRVKAVSLSEEERLMRLLMPWELAGVKSTDSGDVDMSDAEDADGEDEPDTLVDDLTPSSSSDEVCPSPVLGSSKAPISYSSGHAGIECTDHCVN